MLESKPDILACMHPGAFHVVSQKTADVSKRSFKAVTNILFTRAAYAVGIIGSFFNIPQLITIWVHKNAEGVSVSSWIGFSVTTLFWLAYAIYHKEKVLIITFGLTLAFQIAIVVGSALY